MNWIKPEEAEKLSQEESKELDDLRFRCYTDLPFSSIEYKRLDILNRKCQ